MTPSSAIGTTPEGFASVLLAWFDLHALDLPWRGTGNPYHVWLSEVMLQQTQIDTVRPYYRRFLEKYPTLQDLAHAPVADILKLWEGLGYYSRARRLHQTAQTLMRDYDGHFPRTVPELMHLPGIGRYTAGAIASIAFGNRAPVLDGNVERILTRLHDLSADVRQTATQKHLWHLAESHLPHERIGDYNQALMELGQRICTPRQPHCTNCPLRPFCRAYEQGTQAQRPVKSKRPPIPHYDVVAGIIGDESGRILIAQRPPEGLLGGLWEFPGGKVESGETHAGALERELKEELAIEVHVLDHIISVKHAFTHFKITLHAYACRYIGAMPPHDAPQCLDVADWAWVHRQDFTRYSFGKADRLIIAHLLADEGRLL